MTLSIAANRYGSIAAEIYDIDKPFGALPDTAFYLDRLAGLGGEILEPACGSGRTLVPLLRAGHRVAGFDPSREMLARCEARAADEGFAPDLRLGRFDDFAYDRPFAGIVMPAGSFTLIDDFAAAAAVLKRFYEHLQPGGLLMVDIQPLAMLAASGDDRRGWATAAGDYLTLEGIRLKTDWLRQRIEYRIRYERWRDHKLVAAELEPMVQRYWGLEEFRMALAAAGFVAVVVHGSYDRSRRVRKTDRTLTFEAIRPL